MYFSTMQIYLKIFETTKFPMENGSKIDSHVAAQMETSLFWLWNQIKVSIYPYQRLENLDLPSSTILQQPQTRSSAPASNMVS